MTHSPAGKMSMPHWIHLAATYWTRAQLTLATLILTSLASISLGFAEPPKSVLVFELIKQYPGPAVGLGGALLVLSVLAFVIAGRPERTSALVDLAFPQGASSYTASVTTTSPHYPLPPRPASPSTSLSTTATGTPAPVAPSVTPAAPTARGARTVPAVRGQRWRTAAVVVLIVVSLALAGSGVALAVRSSNQLVQAPGNAVAAYCADLKRQDYSHAFQLVSSRVQSADGTAEFTHYSQLHDQVDGAVHACQPAGSALIASSNASLPVKIIRTNTYQATAHLVLEQGSWRLDFDNATPASSIAVPLAGRPAAGSDVAPLAVAENWCQALVARNLGLAYDTFSVSYQDGYSLDKFVQDVAGLESDPTPVDLKRCDTPYEQYQPPTEQTNTLSTALVLTAAVKSSTSAVDSASDVVALDIFVEVTRQGSTWKVSDWGVKDS